MAGDPKFDTVELLLPGRGANDSTALTDLSLLSLSASGVNGAKVQTGQTDPFGAANGVMYFPGTGTSTGTLSKIEVAVGTAWGDLSEGDYTMEVFIYPLSNVTATTRVLFDSRPGSAGNSLLVDFVTELRPRAWTGGSGTVTHTNSAPLNQWSHIAIARRSGNIRVFLNGIGSDEETDAVPYGSPASVVNIGARQFYNANNSPYHGYISNFRLSRYARYTENFTPPAAPFVDYFSQISGNITESLAADAFVARAYDIANGALVGSKTTETDNFTIDIKTKAKACHVTVSAGGILIWQPSTSYAVNAKVFPTDPITAPYYYKRLTAGTSGATEPAWPTTLGGRCDDGAVSDAWELVERLIQPITHGPLIPG